MLVTNEGRIKLTDFGLSKLDLERNRSKAKNKFVHYLFSPELTSLYEGLSLLSGEKGCIRICKRSLMRVDKREFV